MKRSDLFREYARVIDMCEGTKIDPMMCVKIRGYFIDFGCDMVFDGNVSDYTFAIGICEGKPVFAGDKLWCNISNHEFTVKGLCNRDQAFEYIDRFGTRICTSIDRVSWTKPDPYAELKKALADGKVIQGINFGGGWVDLHSDSIGWADIPENYRIKPEPVVVTATRTIFGISHDGSASHMLMCTWTDGELSNVEIVQ